MKAVVFNLGCKVNQYESDVLCESLNAIGYEVSQDMEKADIFILNTCAVTAEAERKSRQAVARCRALNPSARIFVCGCASEKSSASFIKDNVVYVIGSAGKNKILDSIEAKELHIQVEKLPSEYEISSLSSTKRTRAYVKIQDGCDSFCSYCIIPYLRGRSRSRAIEDIAAEVERLSKNTKEIVLTGINLMSYGKDIGTDLTALIKRLAHIDVRLRLGSFYAEGITEELLKALFGLKKFCPHFHLSLQSGDEEVLKDMNRRYTPDLYEEKIALIRLYDVNAAITTDIITGYPTESEESHRRTVEFIKRVNFSDIHIFPYSPREGTKAARLKTLPPEVIKHRKSELSELKEKLRTSYLLRNIGIKQSVLIEESDEEYASGYSQYYIRVYTHRENEVVECIPGALYKDGLKEV